MHLNQVDTCSCNSAWYIIGIVLKIKCNFFSFLLVSDSSSVLGYGTPELGSIWYQNLLISTIMGLYIIVKYFKHQPNKMTHTLIVQTCFLCLILLKSVLKIEIKPIYTNQLL